MSDLKPCPMCKARPVSRSKRHFAICHEPYCFFAHPLHNANSNFISTGSVADHIEAWNTRPAEDAKDKEIDNLTAALRSILQNAGFWDNEDDSLAIIHRIAKEALANAPDTGKMEG